MAEELSTWHSHNLSHLIQEERLGLTDTMFCYSDTMFSTMQGESLSFFSDPTVRGHNGTIPLLHNVRGFVSLKWTNPLLLQTQDLAIKEQDDLVMAVLLIAVCLRMVLITILWFTHAFCLVLTPYFSTLGSSDRKQGCGSASQQWGRRRCCAISFIQRGEGRGIVWRPVVGKI